MQSIAAWRGAERKRGIPMAIAEEQRETWGLGDIEREIRAILAKVLEKPVRTIRLDSPLDEGLGVDSLALIETQVSIEERFGVVMPDGDEESVTRFHTVKDLVQAVAEQLGSRMNDA